ncbi:MAG TPA: hypothetical protein VG984_01490 [Candidatus Paceibacterota bacterium]|nr:hypothetical protein [Candidatus Paceibacterota bacterium]
MAKKSTSVRLIVITGLVACAAVVLCAGLVYAGGYSILFAVRYGGAGDAEASSTPTNVAVVPTLDTHAYDVKLLQLAHVATSSPWYEYFLTGTTTATTTLKKSLWPVKTTYPNYGALLPNNRIVAYYGNFYSKGMGVLGEYPEDVMLQKLKDTVAQWQAADPSTPVIPAIDYIDVTAQGSAGKDGKYRLRMPDSQIDKALDLASKVNGIVILDIQVGLSNLQSELPLIEKYLAMPNVHLAIDPEFAMHNDTPPGRVIGTMSSADVNYAANFLADLVKRNNLPPKILIVHRFTEEMVTGYQNIKPLSEVQIVMDMDGWGFAAKKINTYNSVVYSEPVQFTGFKLFYKNDLKPPSTAMMTPEQVLKLTPAPSFIQYQ